MSDVCPMCRGQTRPGCLCKGAGSLRAAYDQLQEMYLRERNQHAESKAESDQLREQIRDLEFERRRLQKMILEFVFNPHFRRLDRRGWMKNYWEQRLECRLAISSQAPASATEKKIPLHEVSHFDRT